MESMKEIMLKKRIILFGAGFYGKNACNRLKEKHTIECIIDNNADVIGSSLNGVLIKSVDALKEYDLEDIDIIICSKYYGEMATQLNSMGINRFFVTMEGFIYLFDEEGIFQPVEIENNKIYRKENGKKTILFVQNAACIRTHKIAKLMREAGYNVCLLYTLVPPINGYLEYKDTYENIWGFSSEIGIIDFINNSDFDIIHCSNEPDILATVCKRTNKPVVFDTHDMQSVRGSVDSNALMLEYLANKCCDANMYVSEGIRDIAIAKYNLEDKDIFVLRNMVYDQVDVSYVSHKKLSDIDNEIHSVYEGGVVGDNKGNHRYFKNIWLSIAEKGIHIHFYSNQNVNYCRYLDSLSPYIHYEGEMAGTELIKEMVKYDCGLVLFNVTDQNRTHLEKTSTNKIYEYINAGLPIIVGDINTHINFVKEYKVGCVFDSDNIEQVFNDALKIEIDRDFLKNNRMTLKSKQSELRDFYELVMKKYREKNK